MRERHAHVRRIDNGGKKRRAREGREEEEEMRVKESYVCTE